MVYELKGVSPPKKKNEAMAILECPVCHRKRLGGLKQAKNEGYGGNSGGYEVFHEIKKDLEFLLNPYFYHGSGGQI